MRFFWQHNDALEEVARKERGKLAEAVVRNDRVRSRLTTHTKDTPIGDMLQALIAQIDEGRRD